MERKASGKERFASQNGATLRVALSFRQGKGVWIPASKAGEPMTGECEPIKGEQMASEFRKPFLQEKGLKMASAPAGRDGDREVPGANPGGGKPYILNIKVHDIYYMRRGKNSKKPILMRGWDFSDKDYAKAWRDGRLLTASIENTNYCNLDCEYCFRGGTPLDHKIRFENEILREELLKAIDAISELGVRTINIIGAGEPLLDEQLGQLLGHISNLGIIPVIATNGSQITPKMVKTFEKCNTSVCIKMNTFNTTLQNKLARREGYAEKRDYGLKLLMEAGFNKPAKGYQTRLAINSIVFQDNKNETLNILRYCRENNIMPIMATFIPIGRTKDRTDQEVSLKEFLEISKKAKKIDLEEYGIRYQRLLPYLGGVPCTQCGKASMFLTISGDIYDCVGQLHHYGNIKNISISEAFQKLRKEINNKDFNCPPRLEYWKKTGQLTGTE